MRIVKFRIWRLRLFPLLCALLWIWHPPLQASASEPMILGVCVDLWNSGKDEIDKTIKAAKAAHFNMIRWDVPWKSVEKEKGVLKIPANWDYIVDTANKAGIQSLLILDYGNKFYDAGSKPISVKGQLGFGKYSEFVVRHFRGRVKYYEIWNEWDTENGPTARADVSHYIKLLKHVYPLVKAADKNGIYLAGNFSEATYEKFYLFHGLVGDFREFLKSDVCKYMDGFAIHPYVRSVRKMDMKKLLPEYILKISTSIHDEECFRTMPIYVTEFGWSTNSRDSHFVTEVIQSDYIFDGIVNGAKTDVKSLVLYSLRDSSVSGGYGLLNYHFLPKASFSRMSAADFKSAR